MTTNVYGVVASPPVRLVLFTAKLVGRPTELKITNPVTGDHMKPEFLKLNPLHSVPTIDDDGFILFESNVIAPYLVDKYAKSDSLYPKDLKKRALVNQRLIMNYILFTRCRDVLVPFFTPGSEKKVRPESLVALEKELENLDVLIGDSQWVAGTDSPTIADIGILCTMDNLEIVMKKAGKDKLKLQAWLKRMRQWAETNLDSYSSYFKEMTTFIEKMKADLGINI